MMEADQLKTIAKECARAADILNASEYGLTRIQTDIRTEASKLADLQRQVREASDQKESAIKEASSLIEEAKKQVDSILRTAKSANDEAEKRRAEARRLEIEAQDKLNAADDLHKLRTERLNELTEKVTKLRQIVEA